MSAASRESRKSQPDYPPNALQTHSVTPAEAGHGQSQGPPRARSCLRSVPDDCREGSYRHAPERPSTARR